MVRAMDKLHTGGGREHTLWVFIRCTATAGDIQNDRPGEQPPDQRGLSQARLGGCLPV